MKMERIASFVVELKELVSDFGLYFYGLRNLPLSLETKINTRHYKQHCKLVNADWALRKQYAIEISLSAHQCMRRNVVNAKEINIDVRCTN